MDQKLTIKLNGAIIEQAKEYAQEHNQSLSRLIEAYLKSLVKRETKKSATTKLKVTPFVKGIRTGKSVPGDVNLKESYNHHLLEKYK